MDIKISRMHDMPCMASGTLNGIEFDLSDFGSMVEVGEKREYCCTDKRFVADLAKADDGLLKYGVWDYEYQALIEFLEKEFNVGKCGWCE